MQTYSTAWCKGLQIWRQRDRGKIIAGQTSMQTYSTAWCKGLQIWRQRDRGKIIAGQTSMQTYSTAWCKGWQIWRQRDRQDYSWTDKHADVQPGVKVDRFGDRETGKIIDGQTGMQTYSQV